MPFEQYLKQVHAEQYNGLDDNMPDDFDVWLSNLEHEELIKHGDDALLIRDEANKLLINEK